MRPHGQVSFLTTYIHKHIHITQAKRPRAYLEDAVLQLLPPQQIVLLDVLQAVVHVEELPHARAAHGTEVGEGGGPG